MNKTNGQASNYIIKGRKTYEEACIKFSNLRYQKKIVYKILIQNNLQFLVILMKFVKNSNFKRL